MNQSHVPPPRRRGRLRAWLYRWRAVLVCAIFLLAVSQMLWHWQSWPVRQLLDQAPGAEPVR